jgi:hypothetical protein
MAELDDHWRRQGGGDGQENGRQAEQDQLDLTHGVNPLFLLVIGDAATAAVACAGLCA